ncbi:MAG TPA: hypothetical protein VGH65_07300 [Verrucomicrobiaceae bacterium]|jgi:hypothetical protein
MKPTSLLLATLVAAAFASSTFAEPPPKPKGPPPSGGKGGPGGSESDEMKALLKSFNLSADQQAKYDAAKKKTSGEMQRIHVGKEDGSLKMDDVLKQALASHKGFNAAVKEILSPEQYAKWEPLRESDHHKIAQAHKERDEAEAAKKKD